MSVLPLSVLVPAILAAVAPWLVRRYGARVCAPLALVPAGLAAALVGAWAGAAPNAVPTFSAPWGTALNLDWAFRLDGLALLFACLILGIGALVLLYCAGYFGEKRTLGAEVVGWLLAFLAAMLGIVIADNLILLFVFWELTSITSFLLIGVTRTGEARKAAQRALFVTALGGLAMLAGFVLLGTAYGTFTISEMVAAGPLTVEHPLYTAALVLVLVGAATKSAQFPFHFWLPGAMAAPTPVSAYLHSATMVKAGVFLLARLHPVLGGTEPWLIAVTALGCATVLVGAWHLPRLADLKQVLAYSTVVSLGLMTLLLGLAQPTASLSIVAAMVFLLAHALYKSALFLSAGSVDHGTGTRDVWKLRGLRRTMPFTAGFAAVAALSMAGVAPFFGFVAKEKAILIAIETDLGAWGYALAAVVLIGALSAVYVAIRVAWTPYFGRTNDVAAAAHESPPSMLVAMSIPAILGALSALGLTLIAEHVIAPAAASVAGSVVAVKLELWHGVTLELMLGLALLVLGIFAAQYSRQVARFMPTKGMPNAERAYDGTVDGVLGFGAWLTRTVQNGRLRVYLIVVLLTFVVSVGAAAVAYSLKLAPVSQSALGMTDAVLALLIVVGAIGTATARSRLFAIFALGLVGIGLSLLFLLYAAPDLALTLLVVEVLTVVLLVIAFQRLPDYRRKAPPGRMRLSLAVAVSVGVAVTFLAWSAMTVPEMGEISETYAQQSYELGQGRNVVNVILVDFRALDTLGEIVVLAIAAIGMMALVTRGRRAVPRALDSRGSTTGHGSEQLIARNILEPEGTPPAANASAPAPAAPNAREEA